MNLERNGAPSSQAPVTTTSEDSHWFGIALLLAGLFLLTVLLMTVAIILVADHKHVSFGADALGSASVAVVGTQLLSGQGDQHTPSRVAVIIPKSTIS